jgi:hypothetical protein
MLVSGGICIEENLIFDPGIIDKKRKGRVNLFPFFFYINEFNTIGF